VSLDTTQNKLVTVPTKKENTHVNDVTPPRRVFLPTR